MDDHMIFNAYAFAFIEERMASLNAKAWARLKFDAIVCTSQLGL